MKATTGVMLATAAGAAAMAAAYASMKPAAKREIRRDLRTAAQDMGDVRAEMCDGRRDMTQMARNIKDQM